MQAQQVRRDQASQDDTWDTSVGTSASVPITGVRRSQVNGTLLPSSCWSAASPLNPKPFPDAGPGIS